MQQVEPEVESPNHAFKRRVHEAAGTLSQVSVTNSNSSNANNSSGVDKPPPAKSSFAYNVGKPTSRKEKNELIAGGTSDRKFLTKSEEARRKMMFRTKPLSNMDSRGIVAACKREFWRNDGVSHMFHAVQETSRIMRSISNNVSRCEAQYHTYLKKRFSKYTDKEDVLDEMIEKRLKRKFNSDVSMMIELQGQEFANLIACDTKWCDPDKENVHTLFHEFPEVEVLFCDHISMHDVRPDSFNQVEIKGPIFQADKVRRELVTYIPFTLCMPVYIDMGYNDHELENFLDKWLEHELNQFDDVQFYVSTSIDEDASDNIKLIGGLKNMFGMDKGEPREYIIIKAALKNKPQLIKAASVVENLVYKDGKGIRDFIACIEMPSTLDVWIQGQPRAKLLTNIASKTNCKILCPLTDEFPVNSPIGLNRVYFFCGKPADVCNAVGLVFGCMPMRLQFDVDVDNLKDCPEEVKQNRQLDEYNLETGVVIEYRRDYHQTEEGICIDKTVHIGIVSTHENITAIIDTYCAMMGIERDPCFEPQKAIYIEEATTSLRRLIISNAKVQNFNDNEISKILNQKIVKLTMDHIARTTASSYRGCSSAAFVSTNYIEPIATECLQRSGTAIPSMVIPTQPLPFICLNSASPFEGPKTFPMAPPESVRKYDLGISSTRYLRNLNMSEVPKTLFTDHSMKFISDINKTNAHLPPAHLAVVNRAMQSHSQGNMFPTKNDNYFGSSSQLNRRNDYNGDNHSEGHHKNYYSKSRRPKYCSATNVSQSQIIFNNSKPKSRYNSRS